MAKAITPYLCVHDALGAIDWYRRHFGASVDNVIEWEGRIGHAECEVAGAVFYLSDEAPALGVRAPRRGDDGVTQSNVLLVADVHASVDRAIAGGATLERPITERHGTRSGWIVDPFGHRWNVGTPAPSAEQVTDHR
jgi:uncharacterized glyoxalase superfamily protein PhnB